MSVALLIIFLGLMALGVPIAISLGAASVIVLITMGDMPLTMVIQLMYTSMNSFVMVAVPLFILAGSLMDEGGIADKDLRSGGLLRRLDLRRPGSCVCVV